AVDAAAHPPGGTVTMHLHRVLPLVLLVGGCAHAPGVATPTPAAGPYDVVIEGGRVVDGTGSPWYYGDVAIKGDRIARVTPAGLLARARDRKSTRLNSSHLGISYAVFCLKKKKS